MNTSSDVVFQGTLLLHAMSTLMMTGLIWFVQVVHYPLLAKVGVEGFSEYEQNHTRNTTWVVGPLMLIELASALYLLGQAGQSTILLPLLGLVLLGLIWGSTLLLQIPAHRVLEQGFDRSVHRRLVRTNWLRTLLWSARSLIVLWMLISVK
jgi:hypothetical protein